MVAVEKAKLKAAIKAIYIRLADMVYPDGNTIKASAGLCHYANYERLRDQSWNLS